jgi:hypothetical protein
MPATFSPFAHPAHASFWWWYRTVAEGVATGT